MKKAKIMELEVRIDVLESEIRKLKEEVEALKATDTNTTEDVAIEEVETNVEAEDVFATPLEELDLSVHTFMALKRAGISTIGDLSTMSEEGLSHIRNMSKKSYFELIDMVGHLPFDSEVAQKIINKAKRITEERHVITEQKRQLALKLSENFAVALEFYAKVEKQADKEGLKWYHMESKFHKKFRKFRRGDGYEIVKEIIGGNSLLETYDCDYFMSDEHPKMRELVTTDKERITTKMCKEAILEDFRVSNKRMNPRTKTYQYALRLIELVKNFEE